MNHEKRTVAGEFQPPHGSLHGYVLGFVASLVFTLSAYVIATTSGSAHRLAIASIAVLAAVQCVVQLVYFLHVGNEFKPRWKLLTFGIMLTIVFIVVAGSLWIMSNLNRHMYSPEQMQKYVQGQDGL